MESNHGVSYHRGSAQPPANSALPTITEADHPQGRSLYSIITLFLCIVLALLTVAFLGHLDKTPLGLLMSVGTLAAAALHVLRASVVESGVRPQFAAGADAAVRLVRELERHAPGAALGFSVPNALENHMAAERHMRTAFPNVDPVLRFYVLRDQRGNEAVYSHQQIVGRYPEAFERNDGRLYPAPLASWFEREVPLLRWCLPDTGLLGIAPAYHAAVLHVAVDAVEAMDHSARTRCD